MADDATGQPGWNQLTPPQSRDDAVEYLINVLLWLDANNETWAAMHVNQAIETLQPKP